MIAGARLQGKLTFARDICGGARILAIALGLIVVWSVGCRTNGSKTFPRFGSSQLAGSVTDGNPADRPDLSASESPSPPTIELADFQTGEPIAADINQPSELGSSERAAAYESDNASDLNLVQPSEEVPVEPAFDSMGETELTLVAVLESVASCYPEIEIAIGEIESAQGKVLSSWGEFDSRFAAQSISQPLGFYQNYQNGAGLGRPLFGGGEVYGGYRIGDGNFEPWYGERETNEGGELKAGFSVPLLKDRAIDARRSALFAASANRDGVSADVSSRLLQFQRFATQAYWDWVASGRAVDVQQQLLGLAMQRVKQIDERVEKGDLATIAQIDNQRFIAKRETDSIKARRQLEKASIKLSLFLRDPNGSPIIAQQDWLPAAFPVPVQIGESQREMDISTALTIRPELQTLNAARREAVIDLQYANNLILPKLDMKGYAAKDLGAPASSKGDKTPFQMQVGLYAEVPLQRREANGKIQIAQGKLTQIDAKCRLTSDKIRAEIQDAASAVNAAIEQIEQSRKNEELARRSLVLGRQSFDEGDIGLIELNIYETSVADAELQLLDAQFKYFYYRAVYETAIRGTAFDRF
jgi:outer membrane protein TolC